MYMAFGMAMWRGFTLGRIQNQIGIRVEDRAMGTAFVQYNVAIGF